MSTPITHWENAEQFDVLRDKVNAAVDVLDGEEIDALADAKTADLAIGTVGRGLAGTDASTDFWILYGCEISGTNPGSRTVAVGAILYQNQVYHVSAKTITTTGSDVVCWKIKDNGSNVHVTKELEIVAGVSASELKDEGDASIYRFGEWIESNTPATGETLSFTSNTAVTYTTDVYNYMYRRIGNTLEINFLVTAAIVSGATNVTEIFIPIPNGFTKKSPTNANFCKYGAGRYDKPSSTTSYLPMIIKDYDDGSEGDKIVMLRNTSSESLGAAIIMNNSGTLTLRGNITIGIE